MCNKGPQSKTYQEGFCFFLIDGKARQVKGVKERRPGPPACPYHYQNQVVADVFWLCDYAKGLRSTLPLGWAGKCARVHAVTQVIHFKLNQTTEKLEETPRKRRAFKSDVTIDAIGQPRGVPNDFKARNEVASGFESILPWITVNKNTEWINYLYYNQQRFINYTDEALTALGQQLSATSAMTWQNRQVLDWLLANPGSNNTGEQRQF